MKTIFYILIILSALFLFPTESIASSEFSVQYFNNMTLSGSPVLTRIESQINNNWGSGSPDPSVNVDRFSARWTSEIDFALGEYLFTVTADDGVRLTIDNQIIINQWVDQPPTTKQAKISLSEGIHDVKLEYYENGGGATLILNWEPTTQINNGDIISIMPLGDSITDGFNIPGAYRIELKNLINNSDFVGSQQNGPPQLTDREHEGHSGWLIHEIQSNITTWLDSQNPEVILLMIGTNDMIGNYEVANAPQRLSTLIGTITQLEPTAQVYVSTLIPTQDASTQSRINTFNTAIPQIVEDHQAQGKKVTYVDMHSGFSLVDLSDGIHPNTQGYAKIAQIWATAILDQAPTTDPEPEQDPTQNGLFTAEYFNNVTLSGLPTLTRTESDLNNNWGSGSPHASVNNDNFSARWTTTQILDAGTYEFTTTSDDGVKLIINGVTAINKWIDQGPTSYTTTHQVDGETFIKMEYYERGGGAVARLAWKKVASNEVPPSEVIQADGYTAQYFNNVTLSGSPILTRQEEEINNNWSGGSPHSSVNSDNFSARWSKIEQFNAGTYRFTVTADDGVRFKINNQTVIDKWIDQAPTTYSVDISLDAGNHEIVMEYYEKGWGAVAKLDIQTTTTNIDNPPPTVDAGDNVFSIEYFNNTTLSQLPTYTASSAELNFDWGSSSPHSLVNADNFSARAVKESMYEEGTYKFSITADDGVRLKIDGITVIDKWIDQGPTTYSHNIFLSGGNHIIAVEYYEKGGGAVLKLSEILQ